MAVEVSNNGGGAWIRLETFTGAQAAGSSRSYDISGFIAANTRVRFIEVGGYTGTDSFFVDNVQVAAGSSGVLAGHWQVVVDTSSAVTGGDDLNAFGLRAHDGNTGAGGTELNVYYDSQVAIGVNDTPATNPQVYTFYPYVVSGCSCYKNDWDWDSDIGTPDAGSLSFASRTGAFTRNFPNAQMSENNEWLRNPMTGWTTDALSTDYGLWTMTPRLFQTGGNANYGNVWVSNFQAASATPGANPTANAFRVYLPTDGGGAPVKPYLEQLLTHVSGPNPPVQSQTTTYSVTVRVVNPTAWPVVFSSPTNVVTSNVPATAVTYQDALQVSQGTVTSQPAVGGTGNVVWNPGTLAAGTTGLLAYRVNVTPTMAGQRVVVTGTPASNGTRAQFVDETANTAQTRATMLLGPICELAAQVGLLTPAVVSSVRARSGGRGVVVEWETVSEVGTLGFDLLRWDPSHDGWTRVNADLVPGLLSSPEGGVYRVLDPGVAAFSRQRYAVVEREQSGEERVHGPFEVTVESRPPSGKGPGPARGASEREARPRDPLGKPVFARRGSTGTRVRSAPVSRAAPPAPAMKIGVRETGIHYLSAEQIAATLGLPTDRVQRLLLRHRFALSVGSRRVPWLRATGGAGLLFYGVAIDSLYSRDNVYWLRVGPGLAMRGWNGRRPDPADPGQTFTSILHAEEDHLAATAVSSDPESDYWYWDGLIAGDPTFGVRTFTLGVAGLVPGAGDAALRVSLHGAGTSGIPGEHHVFVSLNGSPVGDVRWQGLEPATLEVPVSSTLLQDGPNTVELRAVREAGVPAGFVYLQSFDLAYPRRYQADGDALLFHGGGNAVVTVDGFASEGIEVLDVTDPYRPRRVVRATIGESGGGFAASFVTRSADTPYAASAPAGRLAPSWLAADVPSTLRRSRKGADDVIVTTADLVPAAERLAQLRGSQGLRTRVVDIVDVMDEFNAGVMDPRALRDFLAWTKRRWSPAPRFVLLAGAGTFDYKDNLGLGGNLVPPLMAGTPSGLFADDNRMADLDGDDVPDLAIGRVPATTAEDLDAYVSKIEAYEGADGSGWSGRALWTADNPEGADFHADADRLAASLPAGYAPEAIYLYPGTVAATRAQLLAALQSGAGVVNYLGHGGLDRLAAEGLLRTSDVQALTNGEREPLVTALTCIINRFEVPGFLSLGEALALNPSGGAAAVWAPTGLSLNADAGDLGRRFYQALAGDPNLRLGEAVTQALRSYAASDRERSLLSVYNLLGDPALRLKAPAVPDAGDGAVDRAVSLGEQD
jgi:hypothetical protein